MLTVLVSFIVIAIIGIGLISSPALTIGAVALIASIMMFPLWALGIFAVLAAIFGLVWVRA